MGPKSFIHYFVGILCVVPILGCVRSSASVELPVLPSQPPATSSAAETARANNFIPLPPIAPFTTLAEVMGAVRENNPVIKSNLCIARAQQGLVKQAEARPNPEISVQGENIGGNYGGISRAESTLLLSQLVERGGKRAIRLDAAQAERQLARVTAAIANEEILAGVKKAYARTRAKQELVGLAREQLRLALQEVAALQRKGEAGALQLSEVGRATLLQKSAEIEERNAEAALITSKRDLATFWAGPPEAVGILELPHAPPVGTTFGGSGDISQSLLYLQALLESEVSAAKVDIERAKMYQDVRVGAGVKRLQETQDTVFLGEISIPLPLFNNNEGNIDFAQQEAEAAKFKAAQVRNELISKASNLESQLVLLRREFATLSLEMSEAAEKNFRQVKSAFTMGRSSYLELLDRQRVWAETKKRAVEVALSLQETQAELEALVAIQTDDYLVSIP